MTPDERIRRLENLVTVARACRSAQRLYYKFRDQERLILAKRCEITLDKLLADLDKEMPHADAGGGPAPGSDVERGS